MIATPHTPADVASWLYQFGHGWNTKYQNLLNLDAGRVGKMQGDEKDAKQLIMSFQEMDINVPLLHQLTHHGEVFVADGELDPITLQVMSFPRCAMPDHAPPPNASFSFEHTDLEAAVASYQLFEDAKAHGELAGTSFGATGSGSWPVGCDPEWPDNHSTVVEVITRGASSEQRQKFVDGLPQIAAAEAEIGQHVRFVVDKPISNPQHRVTFGPLPGNTIGYAYFPTPGQCRQIVKAVIDSTFNASIIALLNLGGHEFKGHSDGLPHTRGGIMNPSLVIVNPFSWIRDTSFSRKKAYFGGVAISPREVTPDDFNTAI